MNEIELGADIVSADGEKVGVVDSLVIDPQNGTIQSVVVRKGFFFPTDKILPIAMIADVTEERVALNASAADIEGLTEYMDSEYVMPPAGYYGAPGYMWPSTQIYNSDLLVDEQIHERMPNAVILSEGTLVVDVDGDDVGRVTELYSDDQGRVIGVKVEEGFFRHHDHYIPAHVITSADDNLVRLSVDKGTLESITSPEGLRAARPSLPQTQAE
jgi:uncharacterized protein YrrD